MVHSKIWTKKVPEVKMYKENRRQLTKKHAKNFLRKKLI